MQSTRLRQISLVFVLLMPLHNQVLSQQATLLVEPIEYEESFEGFSRMTFEINGKSFVGGDTGKFDIPLAKQGWDTCMAYLDADTLHFVAKFKSGHTYRLRAGCCCAAFDLRPEKDAGRGAIRLENTSQDSLGMTVALHNGVEAKAGEMSKYIYAFESAMCLYKPASITVASPGDFEKIAEKAVDPAPEKPINGAFLFLHKEKITATRDLAQNRLNFNLEGYLTEKEIEALTVFE